MTEPSQILFNPRYYLEHLDLDGDSLEFYRIDIPTFRAASFMDKRLSLKSVDKVSVRVGDAFAAKEHYLHSHPLRRFNYLFHTAFCGSTLLAKCLDTQGVRISFREPQILMQFANLKRTSPGTVESRKRLRNLLELAVFFLSFAGNESEQVTLKPMNSANNLIEEILALPSTGRTVLLYADLETFLLAILRGGEVRRAFVRGLFKVTRNDTAWLANLSATDREEMTDMQLAVLVWHVYMDQYLSALSLYPLAGVKTLDQRAFFDQPARILGRLAGQFGYALSDRDIRNLLDGPLFRTHSKDSHLRYDPTQRATENSVLRERHSEDFRALSTWSDRIPPGSALKLPLPSAL